MTFRIYTFLIAKSVRRFLVKIIHAFTYHKCDTPTRRNAFGSKVVIRGAEGYIKIH